MLAYVGLDSVPALLHAQTGRGQTALPPLRGLVRALLDEAEQGDPVARDLVRDHGRGLGDLAGVAARMVGLTDQPFALVLTGGVMQHRGRVLRDAIVSCIERTEPGAVPTAAFASPAVGALLLAFDGAELCADAKVVTSLHSASLPGELYAT